MTAIFWISCGLVALFCVGLALALRIGRHSAPTGEELDDSELRGRDLIPCGANLEAIRAQVELVLSERLPAGMAVDVEMTPSNIEPGTISVLIMYPQRLPEGIDQ